MALCTLTDLTSWFTCAQSRLPFGELTTIVVFLVFAQVLKAGTASDSSPLIGAFLIATLVALGLLGLGAVSSTFAFACIIITALAIVILPKV